MSHTVTLHPSGHQFTAEPRESVLEAALRAGLNLRYSCTSGTCGECKARVLSGSVGEERFHDFPLSEAERVHHTVLLCSVTAGSDLTIEAHEAIRSDDIPRQRIDGKVWRLEEAGSDYRILQVRTPRSRTLQFLAGQQVRLATAAGDWCGAVASCPCNGMVLQFHLPRNERHPFLHHAFTAMRPGEPIHIDGPFGRFALDESAGRPLVLAAWAEGLAPVKSLLEHAISLELGLPMSLQWAAPAGGHYLANYCRSIADAVDEFRYRLLDGDRAWEAVAAETVADTPEPAGVDLYVAGPEPYVAAVSQAYTAAGLSEERITRLLTDQEGCNA